MNYYFIAKMFDIKINRSLSSGKKIDSRARISNGSLNYKRKFENGFFKNSIGQLEANALENCTYLYETGDFNELRDNFRKKYNDYEYLNYLMRKMQIFLNSLWLVKDNSVHLELGFLHVYPNNSPASGTIQSNFIAASPTNCYGEYKEAIFSDEELNLAIKYNELLLSQDWDHEESSDRLPARNPFSKESIRVGRALYFLMIARSESVLPLKIMNYCSVLECLFTSDNTEVTHKVAERFARFIGKDFEDRKRLFKLVKDTYKIRSKAVHGQVVKDSTDSMKSLLKEMDNYVRIIFVGYFTLDEKYHVFDLNNEEFEKWFTDIILD